MTATIFGQNNQNLPPVNRLDWQRPQFWRALPSISASDEKVVGLFAVGPSGLGNVLAFTCAGNYTVDWGDGVTENINSGVQANHEYDFADADLANTDAPITITAATGLFTRVGHGFANGDVIHFFRIQTTTGISENTTYWVINATPNTFQVAASKGGAAVALTGDGSAALSPYKQAIVIITPQGGAQLTSVNLAVMHSSVSAATSHIIPWLDLAISLPNCSASGLTIEGSSNAITYQNLQQCVIKNVGALTSMSYMFNTCNALRSVSIAGCNAVTNMSYMFNSCALLTNVQLFNTGAVTDTNNMFSSCLSLQIAPLFDTSAVTNAQRMFYYCETLQYVPQYNFSSCTNAQQLFQNCWSLTNVSLLTTFGASCNAGGMFQYCYALQSVSLPNTHNIASMSAMFDTCYPLQSVSLPNTQNVTNMSSMFLNCYALISVSLPNTGSVTDMSNMFNTCNSLQSVYLPNTGKVTTMNGMFRYCYALPAGPALNTASVTDFTNMFQSCASLQSVPLYNMTSATNATSMFNLCYSLKTAPAFVIGGVNANLNGMFSGCYSLQSVGAMVTSTATNFGSMFNNCYNLQSVPALDTSLATNVNSMFYGCLALQSAPVLNTPLATNFGSMFQNCFLLTYVPTYSTNSATNLATMFNSCYQLTYAPPLSPTSGVTVFNQMFTNCHSLRAPPGYNLSAATTVNNMLSGSLFTVPAYNLGATNNTNLASVSPNGTCPVTQTLATGARYTHGLTNQRLSKAALELYFSNLGIAINTSQTLTIAGNPGVDAAISKSGLTITAFNRTIPMANTSGLVVGMWVYGGQTAPQAAATSFTADVAADTLTYNGHGLVNGVRVALTTLGTVTGVTAYTPYYVVNATANTIQIALTAGGAPIDLTGTNASVGVRWMCKIESIDPNVSITLDTPPPASGSGALLSARIIDPTLAYLKGWLLSF